MDVQNILERAAEQLAEDESLRSNLTDAQASTVLQCALNWLEKQLEPIAMSDDSAQANSHVVQTMNKMRAVNHALNSPHPPPLQVTLDEHFPTSDPPPSPARMHAMSLIRRATNRLRSIWRRSIISGPSHTDPTQRN